ncbi:MAG TPA: FAD-binding oxidoreductase [Acidimicrobiales bacterium]
MPPTPPEPAARLARPNTRELSGWGRTAPTGSDVRRPTSMTELERALPTDARRGLLARGLGRGYGDCAQNSGGTVVETTDVDAFTILESDDGTDAVLVTAEAGASIDRLLHALVPQGLFVPVTPGTRYVTVGGAIASDIHGKNHHKKGSWCQHVTSLRIQLASGDVVEIGPDRDPELFWATAGGMGLTGVVLDATFRCPRIGSSQLLVDTDRAADLDEVLDLMASGDHAYDYSVAWIDLMAGGRSTGRSVLTRGRFASAEEAAPKTGDDPLAYQAGVLASAPPFVPNGLLNRLTVRAFNEVWFRKAPVQRREELQTIPAFFHPLDMVDGWNRIYGPAGFLQWQFVIPFGAERTLRRIVEELGRANCTSFLAVLKAFGESDPGPLSFPAPGWTLALDIPTAVPGLGPLLDRLDELVVAEGGRVYLAKDSRVRPELVPAMYPRLDEWRDVRRRVDPEGRLTSDLSRRLGL